VSSPHPTQPERTALAEHRTSAATLVVSLVVLRQSAIAGSTVAALTGAGALGISLLELGLARRGYWSSTGRYPRAALAAASAVGMVAISGVILSLT
jgi:hypothetical protein